MEWHLDHPPFPPMVADDDEGGRYFWEADCVRLPNLWPEPARLEVHTDRPESGPPGLPSAAQRAAFIELSAAPRWVAAVATLDRLRECGRRFASATEAELRAGLRLLAVHIGGPERDGVAYHVLEFVHEYDEHPFGVTFHRARLVGLAAADDATCFDNALIDLGVLQPREDRE